MNETLLIEVRWVTFLVYCLVGLVNTGISYGIYLLLVTVQLPDGGAVALGYISGMITSFILNSRWTFRVKTMNYKTALRYGIVNLVVLGLSECTYYMIVRMGVHPHYVSQLVNLVPTTLAGFLLNQNFVFPHYAPGANELSKTMMPTLESSKPTTSDGRADPFISVVVPCYNEQDSIEHLYHSLKAVLEDLHVGYELVFVNDGSTDHTLHGLQKLALSSRVVKVVDLSRNFGHQIAVTAGMEHTCGDVVVLIDADLQDPPELIGTFLEKWKQGYDVVYAIRTDRNGETWFKKFTASIFYRFLRKSTDIDIPLDTGDFRLMSRNVVNHIISMPERHRFIRGLVSWVGYDQIGVPYQRQERFAGQSKYPLRKMIKFSLDGITSFSYRPLQWSTKLGFVSALLGFVAIIMILWLRLFSNVTVRGWSSLIVVILFIGGVQLLMVGMLGEYIGRIYDEVRQRPLYVVRQKYNFDAMPLIGIEERRLPAGSFTYGSDLVNPIQ